MNKFKKLSSKAKALGTVSCCCIVGALFLAGCSDSWDDHYDTNNAMAGTQTLWEQISSDASLNNFAQVLKATKVFNSHKTTSVTYADVLSSDQMFTVWAPVISDAVRDSLLNLCKTASGDSAVEKAFVKNHVARYNYSVSPTTDKQITLLNRKVGVLNGPAMTMSNTAIKEANLVATNGVLHKVEHNIPYLHNIYEYICNQSDLTDLGGYVSAYEKDSLNEKASVPYGIVDGQTVYIDSVMIEKNTLLNEIGFINSEDSTYWMIAPTNKAWEKIYAYTKPLFNFSYLANSDSLQQFWAKHAIVNDLIFNYNVQHSIQDSLISSKYSENNPKYHVFYKPYQQGGIMANAQPGVTCSNGKVFRVDEWPFDPTQVFFTPIKVEGERESSILDYTLCNFNMRTALGDSISKNGYLDIVPSTSSANPTVTFQVPNTLSGKYDVCVVCLPKTVYDANSTDFRPYQFKATIGYNNEQGVAKTFNCDGKSFNNNPYVVDTVCVAQAFQFPTCNYNQDKVTVTLKLQTYITSKQTTRYSREMYLDCIYLRPVSDYK